MYHRNKGVYVRPAIRQETHMIPIRTTAVYFSATGTNKKNVEAIAEVFDADYKTIDLTRYDSAWEAHSFERDELVVIGAPVYSGRIYCGAAERFHTLHGDQTLCLITVTYGNRHYDDALLELKDLMMKQGFHVIAGAAMIGEHTYGDIEKGRPNDQDLLETTRFAEKIRARLASDQVSEPVIPGKHPYRDGGNGGGFRPLTDDTCNRCHICEKECPQGAIHEDCVTIDGNRCIACFRCIRICPVGAKNINTPEYLSFAGDFSKKLAARRENEYFFS